MMIEEMHIYGGMGRPHYTCPVDKIYQTGLHLVVVAMSQLEHDYLSALQLMHGTRLNLWMFQDFHDEAWEKKRTIPFEEVMHQVACSYQDLSELLVNPRGDLRWQRILKEQEKRANTPPSHLYYKGFF